MTSAAGGWEGPFHSLKEGIQKLKNFAVNESDPTRRADLNTKIVELERRAQNYYDIMIKREQDNRG